jgi:glyoxylase-like metal-dependent hydrolase (beta-lactamase superfamily II)
MGTLSRRRLLVSAGAGVVGIAVVNTLAGCSSSDEPTAGSSPSGTPETGSTGSTGAAVTGNWQRVDLAFVSAYVLVRGGEVAVVDLGTEGSADSIEAVLKGAGTGWDAVKHVILTHQHSDHAGGLSEVAPLVSASLYAGAADVSSINSTKPLKPLNDGDEVFGLRIVGTPGHTAGPVAVFDPSTGVLVAGDALRATAGLEGPDARYTADMAQAAASVRKLAALDVKTILPGHGAPVTTGAADALAKLADSLK